MQCYVEHQVTFIMSLLELPFGDHEISTYLLWFIQILWLKRFYVPKKVDIFRERSFLIKQNTGPYQNHNLCANNLCIVQFLSSTYCACFKSAPAK